MRSHTLKLTSALTLVFVLCGISLMFSAQAQNDNYQNMLDQVNELLKQKNPGEAFQKALQAVNLDPKRPEAYYYAGKSAYQQDPPLLDAAEQYMKLALERAPDDPNVEINKKYLTEALKTVSDKREFLAHLKAGQQAEEDGLNAKAAREYTAAWQMFRNRSDIGLKAARLGKELDEFKECAKILNYVVVNEQDEKLKEEAGKLLQEIAPDLQKEFDEKLKLGIEYVQTPGRVEEGRQNLTEAAEAMPNRQEPHLHLARNYAANNQLDLATKELGAMLKIGRINVEQTFIYTDFAKLFEDQQFLNFLTDALGAEKATKARSTNNEAVRAEEEQAARKAEEKRKREEAEAEAARAQIERMKQLEGPRQTKTNPKDGAEMILIPAGEFLMGDNLPRLVYLDAYWIYKNDVTVAQYRRFCKETGRKMPEEPSWGWLDDHPMVKVDWNDAAAYCQWAGCRLPTEAEWEKAARGVDGREYPWGKEWDPGRCANSVAGKLESTKPVGSFPEGASPFGLLDMAGNVWQWCADWYDENYYQNAPSRNPTGPASGTYRVLRGGSWHDNDEYNYQCSLRFRFNPGDWNLNFGFRCVQGQ